MSTGMNAARTNSEPDALHPVKQWREIPADEDRDEIACHETPASQQVQPHSTLASEKSAPCTAERCSSPGICVLELQPFCLHHFITCCFERLKLCTVSWCLYPHSATTESYDAFIRECIMTTASLLREGADVEPTRRRHLLEVFLWASELAIKRTVPAPTETASPRIRP
jgi:hypothetical protein